ncbi:antitoxin Xre/MbcA/ParS toxin-binding domain-containing protein (plasmid) [Methylomonas sp. 2BW1-5-20]|uniref:antitoxin Xre/MbcA/ParS toxin-binding domain-containing protein n=1 Tax=Methylomonas sp. 2BW1-5-20 TaxID=3376686 RepID=UPI00404F9B23
MITTSFLHQVISDDGFIVATTLAKVLHITQNDLAEVTGLSRDSVSKSARCKSRSTQARLRDTVEIINRVAEWSGGVGRAFAWFRSQPIPSFGDKTAEDLVKEGRADSVKAYLARIADGGYA